MARAMTPGTSPTLEAVGNRVRGGGAACGDPPGSRAAQPSPRTLRQCYAIATNEVESTRYVAGEERTLLYMTTFELTDDELILVHHALTAFLADFSHDQKDVRHGLHHLLGKITVPVAA